MNKRPAIGSPGLGGTVLAYYDCNGTPVYRLPAVDGWPSGRPLAIGFPKRTGPEHDDETEPVSPHSQSTLLPSERFAMGLPVAGIRIGVS